MEEKGYDWSDAVELYSNGMAQSFRALGIEKTPDEIRRMIEEELVSLVRESIRKQLKAAMYGTDQ